MGKTGEPVVKRIMKEEINKFLRVHRAEILKRVAKRLKKLLRSQPKG